MEEERIDKESEEKKQQDKQLQAEKLRKEIDEFKRLSLLQRLFSRKTPYCDHISP